MSHHETKKKKLSISYYSGSNAVVCSKIKIKISPENNPWHPRALHCECDKICDEHIPDQGQKWQPLVKYWHKVKRSNGDAEKVFESWLCGGYVYEEAAEGI